MVLVGLKTIIQIRNDGFKMKLFITLSLMMLLTNLCAAQDISISTYSTKFAYEGKASSRAYNIATATNHINGVLVRPGEIFSYNEHVGPRTIKNGFKMAHVIIHQKIKNGMGGGACQVSSTLHAAILYAGLEIIIAHPHSLSSTYIDLGLDATVVYPDVDFKFRNNFEFPITIHAKIITPGNLFIEITGDRKPYNVTVSNKIIYKSEIPIVYVHNPNLKYGNKRVIQKGLRAYYVLRTLTITDQMGNLVSKTQKFFNYLSLKQIVIINNET